MAILDALWETQAGAQVVRLGPALVARALSPPGTPAALAVPPRPAAGAMAMMREAPSGPLGLLRPLKPPGFLQKGVARVAAAIVAGFRLIEATVRAAWLACLFAPLAWSAKASFAQNPGPRRTAWADSLRSRLERAGPAFIKWGQWAATRLDLFPPDLCSSLERLHAAAPAHPRRLTVREVQAAFGVESLDELFEGFPDQPLASGSIGQVYRARLSASGAARARLPPGTVVAVKVSIAVEMDGEKEREGERERETRKRVKNSKHNFQNKTFSKKKKTFFLGPPPRGGPRRRPRLRHHDDRSRPRHLFDPFPARGAPRRDFTPVRGPPARTGRSVQRG